MTKEIRTTVEPKDVVAIELECSKCHFKTVRRISQWLRDSSICSNCQENWSTDGHSLEHVRNLASLLRILSEDMAGGRPFMVKLELQPELFNDEHRRT